MDSRIINQEFGINWAAYNGDCVLVARNLPENSIDFQVDSPPFVTLYIYSDSVADLGNTESEQQFFEGYRFAISEMYRTLKPGHYRAVHCKDTMRYMSSHGYAGLYDFPGDIIQAFEAEGFLFQRWVTVWKDPVIEMQRTKTYGLLHKSFQERAEVTRQGCADFVLIFQKPFCASESRIITNDTMSDLPVDAIERLRHLWSSEGDEVGVNQIGRHLSVWSKPLGFYTASRIERFSQQTEPGRLCVVHCRNLEGVSKHGESCRIDMMGEIIRRFESQGNWKFHSRCALTDGTYLVTFRNWRGDIEAGAVKHKLKAPVSNVHTDYIGTEPPLDYHDESYYSILVWQKYASPAWFDLRGLPKTHPDIWMGINQTNVLNARNVKKDEESEKHICPLQLDLIERAIRQYTGTGEIVMSFYGGIGSEGYQAVKLGRRAIMSELKPSYWKQAVKTMQSLDIELTQVDLFKQAGLSYANL